MNAQIKNIQDKINALKENKKKLKKSMNPFNENFNINREDTLMKINFIDNEILKFKQELQKVNKDCDVQIFTTDDIYSINSDQFIEMKYGNKCCPPCTIL
ncbi:hypothetical protein [Spiroplasma endosymbiont of Villa modesta]|uniref:hypothetical protein n=1 Tax=Spiroplasma endosymbiont of Villa modesta TaxID=3066293 RepID=UPI00313E353D